MCSHTILFESFYYEMSPAWRSPHLGVGHIHASGIQPVLYLLCIVDLQEIITTKLHICQLLVVLKEVNGEGHLARCAGCCGEQHRIAESISECSLHYLCAWSTGKDPFRPSPHSHTLTFPDQLWITMFTSIWCLHVVTFPISRYPHNLAGQRNHILVLGTGNNTRFSHSWFIQNK